MKTLSLVLALATAFCLPAFGQSSVVFDTGTTIDITGTADITAGTVTVNGSRTGSGTINGAPLPVTLVSFTAHAGSGSSGILLEWKTVTEINNYGFTVQMKRTSESNFSDIAGAFVAGHGTSNAPHSYSYAITGKIDPQSSVRLKQSDLDGAAHFSEPISLSTTGIAESAPIVFALNQNYPNPFNPSTEFRFSVANSGPATLTIYSILGQEVGKIFDGNAEAGRYYAARFDGKGLASGVYYARLQSGNDMQLRKIVMTK